MSFVHVDQSFSDHLLYLAGTAAAAAAATRLRAQPVWYRPNLNGWSGNPLDIAGMHAAFDRSLLNALYQAGLLQPDNKATVGDAMAAKLQIEYTAGLERAFRTRHATRVRCVGHASARKLGHGDGGGLFLGTILSHVQNMTATSQQPPATTPGDDADVAAFMAGQK